MLGHARHATDTGAHAARDDRNVVLHRPLSPVVDAAAVDLEKRGTAERLHVGNGALNEGGARVGRSHGLSDGTVLYSAD